MYDPSSHDVTESVTRLVESVYAADGMIWSSPLYNGSISGSFKNALDWLILLNDREPAYLTDKVVGLISVAGGTQGLQAINTMEFIVRALRG
jgi:FMN reductase